MSDVIFQGASVRLIARMADGTELVCHVEAGADLPFLRPGDQIWMAWDRGAPYALSGWPPRAGATSIDVDQVQAALDGAFVADVAKHAPSGRARRWRRGR